LAKSLERQLDAHVTADASEQWIKVALRRGVVFDSHEIALKVPDCGYKLRRIEAKAAGLLGERRFVIDGSGQGVDLSDVAAASGQGQLRGHFEAPTMVSPKLVVVSFAARGSHSYCANGFPLPLTLRVIGARTTMLATMPESSNEPKPI
jgi:hypothetical protein